MSNVNERIIKERNKIYYNQTLLLLINFRVMLGLNNLPILRVPPANQDVWIVLLLSIPYILIFSLPLLFLSNKFNNFNLIEIIEKIMGRILGKIVGIYYFLVFLYYLVIFSSTFVEILDNALFRETPTWATASLFLITSIHIAHKGLRNLARLGEVLIPLILVSLFVFVILGYDNYQFANLFPILGNSTFKDINRGAIDISLRFVDAIIATMLTPYLVNKKDLNKVYIRSTIYSLLTITLITITTLTTLGPEFAKRINFPFLTYTRLINFQPAIQGFESVYIVFWIIGNIIRIAGYLYISSVSLGQITGIRNDRFILPLAILTLIAVQLIKDTRPVLGLRGPFNQITLIISFISILVIPIIVIIVYLFRRKFKERG